MREIVNKMWFKGVPYSMVNYRYMSYVVVTYSPNLETFLLWGYDLLLEVQPCLSTNAWRKKEKKRKDAWWQMKLAKCRSLEKERAQMKGYTKKNKWKRDKISWSVINLIQSILGIKNNIFILHLFCPIHPPPQTLFWKAGYLYYFES